MLLVLMESSMSRWYDETVRCGVCEEDTLDDLTETCEYCGHKVCLECIEENGECSDCNRK